MAVLIVWLLVLLFGVGGIVLQIFLARRDGKWPGLVLPLLTFLLSLLNVRPSWTRAACPKTSCW